MSRLFPRFRWSAKPFRVSAKYDCILGPGLCILVRFPVRSLDGFMLPWSCERRPAARVPHTPATHTARPPAIAQHHGHKRADLAKKNAISSSHSTRTCDKHFLPKQGGRPRGMLENKGFQGVANGCDKQFPPKKKCDNLFPLKQTNGDNKTPRKQTRRNAIPNHARLRQPSARPF